MKRKRIFAAWMILVILCSSLFFIPGTIQSAKAVDVSKACAFPSAKNETPYAAPYGIGQTITGDGNYWPDIYQRYGGTWGVITDDFNNPIYPNVPTNPAITGVQALSNATITSVWLVATFPYAGPPIDMVFYLTDMKMYYHSLSDNGPFYPEYKVFSGSGVTWGFAVEVTAYQAWTYAMLRSTTLSVTFSATIAQGHTFFMDYLGLYYTYTQPGIPPGGGTNPGSPSEGTGHGFDFPSFGGSWLISIFAISMGTVGLIGMIGYPAYAIKNGRNGRDRGASLASGVILEALFIGMLYAGLVIANLT